MSPDDHSQPQPVPPPNAATSVTDAIVFVPGLSSDADRNQIDEIAFHLATALEQADKEKPARFRVGDVVKEVLGKSGETQTATIFRELDGQEAAFAKVYGLNYASDLTAGYRGFPALVKFLLLPLALIPLLWMFRHFFGDRSLSSREKAQFGYLWLVLAGLAVYAALLVTSVITSISNVVSPVTPTPAVTAVTPAPAQATPVPGSQTATQPAPTEPAQPTESWFQQWVVNPLLGAFSKIQAVAPTIVVWATLAGLVIPTRDQIQQALENGATVLVVVIQYLWSGEGRANARGKLNALLQDIQESPDTRKARIHIVCHSFGSIITLDTLFRSDEVTEGAYEKVRSLVTIGSPFDFIHLTWPQYFANRRKLPGLRWINIFTPQDILSSNFLNETKEETVRQTRKKRSPDSQAAASVEGLQPNDNLIYHRTDASDELSPLDILRLSGLSSHIVYWEQGKKWQTNAFDMAVPKMLKDKLAELAPAG